MSELNLVDDVGHTVKGLCPKCGEPYIDKRSYPKKGDALYVHRRLLRGSPFPHYSITESCLVKGEYR